jgi:signal transduction histidine kinase
VSGAGFFAREFFKIWRPSDAADLRAIQSAGGRVLVATRMKPQLVPADAGRAVAPVAPACKVLIVEHDPRLLVALQELLDGPDRDMVVAQSGEDALRAVLVNDFAVILLDVEMPAVDGFAIARLIRSREGSRITPIIFLTGSDQDAVSRFRGYEAGAVDYLVKPVLPAVLRSKVSVFIDLFRYNVALAGEIAGHKAIEEDLRRAQDRQRAFAAQIESVREDERTRVSRAVHDDLGQALTGLKMDLSWLQRRLPSEQREATGRVKSMSRLVDTTIRSVRRISSALRPQMLDDVGFIGTLKWQARDFQVRTGIRCKLDLPADDPALDPAGATAAFRIVQEALANVRRHAGATRVDIVLRVDVGHFVLKITDNGRGITPAQLNSANSLGLLGIRERAFLLGGNVGIESKGGKGTTVTLSIPHRAGDRP